MMRNLDTALLRTFLVVAENGGMTAAARQLHVTQAAVSQQVKRLEDVLQVRLFDRERRDLALTAAGERLVGRARRMIELNDELWNDMVRPEFDGEVRLGVPHDVVCVLMPPVLRRFDRAWPRVRVSLDVSTTPILLRRLKDGDLDLTLTTELRAAEGARVLMRDPLVWVGAADGIAHSRDPLPVSLGDERCAFRPIVIDALTRARRNWRSVCENGSMEALNATLEADLGVMAMIRAFVPSHLAVLPAEAGLPPLPFFHVNLHLPATTATPIAVELARHITESLGNHGRRAAA
ncbi:MAG: LysR family transcriptional regulator [Geminicoccaceae bacterium]|nr:LysR family transcriptional regulator [Geminicoccaceae bacterium]